MKEFTRDRRGDGPLALPTDSSGIDRVHVLAVVLALGMCAYLAIEPTQNWLLLLLSGLAALAADSVARHHPRAHFTRLDDTALYLFVPVLFTLGLGIFLEEVVGGYETIVVGMLSVIPYWAILRAEYESIDRGSANYQSTRLVLNIATYVVAFLFFATIYDFDLDLATASFAAGVVSILLAIEVLREEGLDTTRTLLYAIAIGGLVGEAAWTTHFLPLEGSGAAVFLLLAFYLMTGLMHNYLGDRLSRKTAAEFGGVGALGVLIVVLSHVTN
ncbi:MAG TPA: hypothetical protein VMR52_04405 [Dehalococcoidia bacterium]|nr:hypothetical protein [Dehalococcoidia bacterium]